MGSLGYQEMIVIFVLALVLFGPKKLPELGRTLGKAISEFRRASNELKSTWEREMQALERENESLKETTRNYLSDTPHYSQHESGYDSTYDYGAYGSGQYESTPTDPSTVSASASLDAEKTGEAAGETAGVPGTVARETAHPAPEHPHDTQHS